MAYGDFKDLNRRATAHTVLRDKAFNIAKSPKYAGYQWGLVSIKKTDSLVHKSTSGGAVKNEIISNKELAE